MRNQFRLIHLTLFFSLIATSSAFAACDANDPCAPKKVLEAWDKSLAVGVNYTSGNSDTTVVSVLGAVARESSENIFNLNMAYGYGEDRAKKNSDQDVTNKNDFRATTALKHLYNDRFFAVAGSTFLYDEIADVDYRVTLDPGAGYFLMKDDTFKLALDIGPSYVFEKVGNVSDDYLAAKIGDRFDWVLSCTSKMYQLANILIDTEDSSNSLITAEVGIEAAMSSSISLVLLVRDQFDNIPAPDREKNDIQMITALKVSL